MKIDKKEMLAIVLEGMAEHLKQLETRLVSLEQFINLNLTKNPASYIA